MNIPTKESISFNLFYLIEFFQITLKRVQDKIADSHFQLLNDLFNYLIKDGKIIEGLEKVARYQNTNDLAIFIFDMIEKADDFGAEYVYKTLPDLAEDFQNLFSLLIEDEETINALQNIVNDFKEVYGNEQKEKQLEEFIDMVKPEDEMVAEDELVAEEPGVPFPEFYIKELLKQISIKSEQEPDKDRFLKFCSAFIDIAEATDIESGNYSPPLTRLLLTVKELLPQSEISYSKLQDNLEENAQEFVKEVQTFKQDANDEYLTILETGRLSSSVEKTEKQGEAQQTEKPQLNTLLIQYFKSEVEDYFNEIKEILNVPEKKLNQSSNIIALVKKFKGLKEVCMIHGYSGMEYIATNLTNEFTALKDSDKLIKVESVKIIDGIFTDLLIVENFTDKAHGKEHVARVKEEILKLRDSFTVDAVIEEVEKPAEKEEQKETKEESKSKAAAVDQEEKTVEDVIEYSNRAEFLKVVSSFFTTISKQITAHHKNISTSASQEIITGLLKIIENNSNIFHDELQDKVVNPLKSVYHNLFSEGKISKKIAKELKSVWKELGQKSLDELDLDKINHSLMLFVKEDAKEQEKESADLAFNDPQTLEAFIDTSEKLWSRQKHIFVKKSLTLNEYKSLLFFLTIFRKNLTLLSLHNYIPIIDLIDSFCGRSLDNPFSDENASEIEDTFKLFFDRLRTQGKNGNCDDIIEVLNEIFESGELSTKEPEETNPEVAAQETAAEQKTELETVAEDVAEEKQEDKDDITLFREETVEYLKTIDLNLIDFAKTKDRKLLNNIETACHSVRSAAHILNLQDITKLAATIEEAAELFGQSDLPMPSNLASELRIGVQTLENLISNPQTEFSATQEMLESLLDHIVIEDMGAKVIESAAVEEEEIHIVSKPDIEEKPLFSADDEDDEDLREVFKEEAAQFLQDIQNSNDKLLTDPDDEKAAKALGYASHSLRSAAKMLGFTEISDITGGLENLTETISSKEITHNQNLYNKIVEAVDILRDLSQGKETDEKSLAALKASLTGKELSQETVEEINKDEADQDTQLPATEIVEEEEEKAPANLVEVFIEEASQITEELNKDFLEIEKMPESDTLLANILRNLHTLKGSAYISKFNLIGDLAHKLEDFFEIYKEKDSTIKNEMLNSAFTSLDIVSDMISSIKETGSEKIDNLTTRLAEIDNKMFLFQSFSDAAKEGVSDSETKKVADPVKKTKKGDEESILKISTEYMDKLVDMASELMVNQTQLGSHLHALKEVLKDIEGEKKQISSAENIIEDAIESGRREGKEEDIKKISENIKDMVRAVNMIHSDLNSLTEGFEQNIGKISSMGKLLHSDMLKTRMVPVDNLFNRYPRAVRDLAQKQQKKVNLIIEDNDTEMDRAMVEGLAEPILHIIRNAIDHGIELPKERKAVKKSETGTLLLKAQQEKNQIVINIEDDGSGINIDTIRTKILEKELADKEQVEKMSEAEVLDYIFYPGFSTRDSATDVSGRGIGLDAVANQIQKLKGNIRIKTEKNVGTSFNLRVPLTLVISQALMVRVNLQSVAIPVIAVQESIQFNSTNIISENGKEYIKVRGRLLPFMHLREILKFPTESNEEEKADQMAIVIYDAGINIALGIDEVVGRQEVVIKSLGSHLQNVEYISGGTILANGDVALILDYASVIRYIEVLYFGKVSDNQIAKTESKVIDKPTELVSQKPDKEALEDKPLESEEIEEDSEEENSIPTKAIEQAVIKERKPIVIVVDDSNSVRNFVGSILERNNYVIIKSTNGADALEKMKTESIDLVITDLEMPKMHGFDLISNIRKQKKNDNLPIIILTGRAGMKHRQTGEELGANAFIVKPFKEKDLLASIEKFIKIE